MNTASAPSVLVAVGTSGSYAAIDHAADEARRRGARLHLVHACDPATRGEAEARLTTAVRHAAVRLGHDGRVHGELALATPGTAVARAAPHAGLVVVGRRAHVSDARPSVRSVAGGLGSELCTPVVIVPDGWSASDSAPRVVVGLDEPARSVDVLAAALEAARDRSASLTVVTCWWRPVGAGRTALTQVADQTVPQRLRVDVHRALAPLVPAYADVAIDVEVRHARPGEALVAASRDADLMVLGRHTTLVPLASHLGPVARSVVRGAACPVLLSAPSDHHGVTPRHGRATPHPAVVGG